MAWRVVTDATCHGDMLPVPVALRVSCSVPSSSSASDMFGFPTSRLGSLRTISLSVWTVNYRVLKMRLPSWQC